ncbi:MAG: carbohydrate kinase [Clostridiales bacterium]|nr:carbohydrate kinase [Clostridiales bacterium]
MAVAGLDIGTGGCKCTIFNADGKISTYSYMEYSPERTPEGYIELDPELVWNSVANVIKRAVAKHSGDIVEALCITSFGEAGVFLDRNGNVLRNSLLYTDFRGEAQCSQFIEKLGRNEILKRSGHVPHPMFSFSKIMWVKDNEPEVYKKAEVFLQYSDYILYKLSGSKYVDWSLASRTGLFNVIEKKFDKVLLDAAGIEAGIFPTPVQPGTAVAEMNPGTACELGLKKNVKLILGGQDQICAALGAGVLKTGMAVNGIGTVDCITPLFDRPVINSKMADAGFSCIPYMIPGHYVTYAFNYSGGALLRWYKEKFGEAVVRKLGKVESDTYSFLETLAPKEPTGLLVLPHFQGAATPYMDIDAVGAIIGLTSDTDAFSLYRGIMEGVTYEAKVNIDALKEAGVNIEKITVCGGGSRSPMWVQIRADIFDIPVDVLEFEEAGTLGAAILAGTACGLYKDLEEGVNSLVRIKKTYYPDKKNRDIYEGQYTKYKRIYENVRNIEGR